MAFEGTEFLAKLDKWLIQQPEYIMLLALPKENRKQAARLIAKHLTTIPTTKGTAMNRKAKRKLIHDFQRDKVSPMLRTVKGKRARVLAKQQKDAARYGRMSEERAYELALREEVEREERLFIENPTPEGGSGVSLCLFEDDRIAEAMPLD